MTDIEECQEHYEAERRRMNMQFNPQIQKLKQMQSLPLEQKIIVSKMRIRQWHEHYDGNVVVSFSGGIDSTVLLHLVRSVYPEVKAVFVNTGLEYPQIVKFVHTIENVDIVRPKMSFREVCQKYGYPLISKETSQKIEEIRTTKSEHLLNIRLGKTDSKHGALPKKWSFLLAAPFKISARCCGALKKQPLYEYQSKNHVYPFVGVMAEESWRRQQSYMKHTCNAFDLEKPQSRPLMFWSKNDILLYIKKFNIDYCRAIYGDIVTDAQTGKLKTTGAQRTGCTFCMFGVHLEPYPNRFQRMQTENPALYDYCINKMNLKEPLDYCGIPYDVNDYGGGLQLSFEWDKEEGEME